MSNQEVEFTRPLWRDAFDLLDYVDARAKHQRAMAYLIAVWCLVMVAVTAWERLNSVPILWSGACLFWLYVALRLGHVRQRVEATSAAQSMPRGDAEVVLWPEVRYEESA